MNPYPKKDQGRIGIVTGVDNDHGHLAYAQVDGIDGNVLFSLVPEHQVWGETSLPRVDVKVVLFDIRSYGTRMGDKKEKWRAHKARFFRPEDEVK